MKILLTADPYIEVPPRLYGGIERIVATLVTHLRQRGHVVGLVAHPDSRAEVDFFLPWKQVQPNSTWAHMQNMLTLRKACAEFGPAVVHSFSRLLYLVPLLARRVPKIMSYQRYTGGRQIGVAAALAGRSLTFTGCSEFIAAMGRKSGGTWQAIHNFVDTDFYTFRESVPADAPLVFLSRIERIKGTHAAIDIAKRSGRRLLVAGNHADAGPDRAYWDEAVKPELGRNRVEYVGPVDDDAKRALLQSAAALILPVEWDEPFGIVFAEALACGTPVISCARGAVPEIVRDGVEGYLIDGAEQGLAAVRNIAAIDRKRCRERAESAFSARTVVPRYESIYSAMPKAA